MPILVTTDTGAPSRPLQPWEGEEPADHGARRRVGAHRQLITGSAVLVVGAAVQALGGAIFWLIAANVDAKSVVGTGTALFTSVNFVTYIAGLGLPVALARFSVGRSDDADTIYTWSLLATIAASAVVGAAYLGFLVLIHPPSTEPLFEAGGIWPIAFVVSVVGAALSMIFDVRCMTIRRWGWVLGRITLVSVLRLPLVLWIHPDTEPQMWLFAWSVIPLVATGVIGAPLANRLSGGRLRLGPRPRSTNAMIRYSAVNFVSTIGYQAPYFALPIIVLAHVSADTNAAFYVAWGVVSTTCWVPYAIGQALLAEGGKEGHAIQGQVRMAMIIAVGIMAVAAVAAVLGSGIITIVYGEQYADAAKILPEMMLAGVPWAISSLYLTEARVLHRHLSTVLITTSLTLAIIIPALFAVPDSGIEGAAHSWLFGNLVGMVVALAAHFLGDRIGHSSASLLGDAISGVEAQAAVVEVTRTP